MNDSRLSSSIKRWAAAGNNSAAGAKRKACGMALFARSLDPAAAVSAGRHFGLVRRCVCIGSECVDHAWASGPTGTLARKIAYPEQLHSDVISESARAMVDAMLQKFEAPSNLTPV
jgi:hypothetical protein